MPRNVPITPEKEQEIIAALQKDSHGSREARTLGDVSYATVWQVADRNAIALRPSRETMGRPRLPAELWATIAREVAANPNAMQKELARKIGVSRSTVGRVMRTPRDATPAKLMMRVFDRRRWVSNGPALADGEDLCAEKSITRLLIQEERNAVADNLRQIGGALALSAILGSCTGADIENAALGAAKSWCRLHSPQYCSVNDERPSLQ